MLIATVPSLRKVPLPPKPKPPTVDWKLNVEERLINVPLIVWPPPNRTPATKLAGSTKLTVSQPVSVVFTPGSRISVFRTLPPFQIKVPFASTVVGRSGV